MSSKRPTAIVLRTAGINCDAETVRALELAGANVEVVHLHALLHEQARLDDAVLVVIPGGFSYGDDVAAGRVFGLELRHGLAESVAKFIDRGGHVLGVCNGFQILVESGLFEREVGQSVIPPRTIALTNNASNRFECRWVSMRAEPSACAWLAESDETEAHGVGSKSDGRSRPARSTEAGSLDALARTMPVPIAHGEGRFVARDASVLERLRSKGQIALRYVKADGTSARGYPENPNGSVDDIAGICDPSGRVLGLMPHPERNVTPWNHPHWQRLQMRSSAARAPRSEGEGLSFYRRLVRAAAGVAVPSIPVPFPATTS
jgi:phosphoribosylformylglycinamidine synthase